MRHFTPLPISVLLAGFLIPFGCGKGESTSQTDKKQEAPAASLLVDKIAVAAIPGGWETIVVTATDAMGLDDPWLVTSDDPDVAMVSAEGPQVTVTGRSLGDTSVTISSHSGLRREIPVRVYSPMTLDVGDLTLGYVDRFTYRWNDRGSGGANDGSFWHPVVPDSSWHALGSLGFSGYYDPNGLAWMMIVKERPGSAALVPPTDYDLEFYDVGSGADDDGSLWTPICPAGYVALGSVAQRGWGKPSPDDVRCVRRDLTRRGAVGDFVWNDRDTGSDYYVGSWRVTIPDLSLHEHAYLETGTFFAQGSYLGLQRYCTGTDCWEAPYSHPVMNVLSVDLPMLVDTPWETRIPMLAGYEQPPVTAEPMMLKSMLVPFSALLGGENFSRGEISWLVNNSPFVRVERFVFNKLMYHGINNTSLVQENMLELKTGVATTNSETMSHKVGVSVTHEGGVEFMGIGAKTSVTVSYEFGYESMHSVTELQEKTIKVAIFVPPGKAGACWQQRNKYRVLRHNADQLDTMAEMEFGIDTYVVDEYPHGP